jgi:hypothetical protein
MATRFLANINLSQNELQNARVQNLTTTQINAISAPVDGQIVYDSTLDYLKYYNGSAWVALSTATGTVTTVTASSPLASTGGNTPDISIQDGTTSAKGAVQLEDSYSSTSTTKAATPAAVKAAYDLAAGKASTANKLSDFAATTSAELAGVITDETGSGALVFATSPTLVTPNIGVASGTSLTLSGDLTVNGTTTTVNSTTVTVDDKNLELGSIASPTDAAADGGGITLKGTTDKTLNWVDATDAWTSSENFNLATGKVYEINGTSVLSASTLGSGVTASSLTSVGTITSGVWNGTDIAVADGGTGASDAAGAKTNLGFMTRYAVTATWTAGENKTVTHSLGTKDVIVNVYDSSDAMVIADVVTTSTSAITVMCSVAGDYRVVVIG